MSPILERVRELATRRKVRVSAHGYARLAKRGILVAEIMSGVETATAIEDYPEWHKGPGVLVLQFDSKRRPLHVVWGIEKGTTEPAVIVTAYYPDAALWGPDFRSRQ